MDFEHAIETAGKAVDVAGVATIIVGVIVATVMTIADRHGVEATDLYRRCRRRIGRAILLGLELLVAADIIRTVAVAPTFTSAGVLAIIVAIRTFLSVSLEVELEGRWPWQSKGADPATA